MSSTTDIVLDSENVVLWASIIYVSDCFCGCHIFCAIQFHNAMEEFSKALLKKSYVDAANQLERVRAVYNMSTQLSLFY